ncbi:MAG TPA: flavodoxin domain-containing protein [Candidatus Limnocylindrales bacterium]|jgi:menaquinone-dependent protoporphyrinogen oxidase|nr:flavodoxin domain-containing protein [Candidatus Limnocylindrales bacterium]
MTVLVSASSRHGSTMEIAHVIAGILTDRGIEAEVREPEDVTTLDGVEAIVLGSGVYLGRWLEPAKAFVERFAPAFATRRVWLYSSGPLGDPAKPEVDPVDAAALIETTHALDHRVFPGRLVGSDLGLGERLIVKGVRAPYGDFRPWPDITEWVGDIANQLAATPVATA